jgi:hypothetical protein
MPDLALHAAECPECGCSPEHDLRGRPYDCTGFGFDRHAQRRPVVRPVPGRTFPGHDGGAPLTLRHRWMRTPTRNQEDARG